MSGSAVHPARTRRGSFDMLLLAVVLIALWQALGSWTLGIAITPPAGTLAYLVALVRTEIFWGHVAATLQAFLMAFALSALLGLALGLVLGLQRFAADVAEPILAGFYTIPKVTLYPVVLLVCGLGVSAKVTFGVMHGLVPVTLFTLGAVRNLPPVLLRAARAMRLTMPQAMRTVLIPACLPDIMGGLRIGFSLSLLGVLIGEMFSSQRGLGFLLVSGLAQHNVPLTTSVVVVIVAFAIVTNTAMLRLSRMVARRG
jgi:NitT/TauT family transport system permease protein